MGLGNMYSKNPVVKFFPQNTFFISLRYFDGVTITVFPIAIRASDILTRNNTFSFLLQNLQSSHSVISATNFDRARRIIDDVFMFFIRELFDLDLKYFLMLVMKEFREEHNFFEKRPNSEKVSFLCFFILSDRAIIKNHFVVFSHFCKNISWKQCFILEIVEKFFNIFCAFVFPSCQRILQKTQNIYHDRKKHHFVLFKHLLFIDLLFF